MWSASAAFAERAAAAPERSFLDRPRARSLRGFASPACFEPAGSSEAPPPRSSARTRAAAGRCARALPRGKGRGGRLGVGLGAGLGGLDGGHPLLTVEDLKQERLEAGFLHEEAPRAVERVLEPREGDHREARWGHRDAREHFAATKGRAEYQR